MFDSKRFTAVEIEFTQIQGKSLESDPSVLLLIESSDLGVSFSSIKLGCKRFSGHCKARGCARVAIYIASI